MKGTNLTRYEKIKEDLWNEFLNDKVIILKQSIMKIKGKPLPPREDKAFTALTQSPL